MPRLVSHLDPTQRVQKLAIPPPSLSGRFSQRVQKLAIPPPSLLGGFKQRVQENLLFRRPRCQVKLNSKRKNLRFRRPRWSASGGRQNLRFRRLRCQVDPTLPLMRRASVPSLMLQRHRRSLMLVGVATPREPTASPLSRLGAPLAVIGLTSARH